MSSAVSASPQRTAHPGAVGFWLLNALILLLILFFLWLPIKMGEGENAQIPLIGPTEAYSEEYVNRTLQRAVAAYAVAKIADKVISTIQRTEFSATPLGLGVSLAPGELLAAVNDALERVSSALFALIGLLLLEKLALGLVSWLCLKLMLPAGLALALLWRLISCRNAKSGAWLKAAAVFLIQSSLTLWLLMPLSAALTGCLEQAYLQGEYQKESAALETFNKELNNIDEQMTEANRQMGQAAETEAEESGWLNRLTGGAAQQALSAGGWLKNSFDLVSEVGNKIIINADEAAENLFRIFCLLALTTALVPLFTLFMMYKLTSIAAAGFKKGAAG